MKLSKSASELLERYMLGVRRALSGDKRDDIAREIRTGQLKPGPALTETALKTKICDRLKIIVSAADCPDALEVDLREFPTFAAAAAVRVKLTADRDIDTSGFDVDPGLSQSRNMLRVF